MNDLHLQMDRFLAETLRAGGSAWPRQWQGEDLKTLAVERIKFHGIGGLLVDRNSRLAEWPDDIRTGLQDTAVNQAMWEMRHKIVVTDLLAALARGGVKALVLKGTALAYDVYPVPATRTRGDTDILVGRADLARTRAQLLQQGFRPMDPGTGERFDLQEVWQLTTEDGALHEIDLHWEAVNSHAMSAIFTSAHCSATTMTVARLSGNALAMDRVAMLVHACIHRAQHMVSPYIIDGVTYYDGNRLIWIYDLHLLAKTFTAKDWRRLCDFASEQGLASVCLGGLQCAVDRFATPVPDEVIANLGAAQPHSAAERYLLRGGQARRAWMDLFAIDGIAERLRYVMRRILPSEAFMRAKYSDMSEDPLTLLYMRRFAEFWRRRAGRRGR